MIFLMRSNICILVIIFLTVISPMVLGCGNCSAYNRPQNTCHYCGPNCTWVIGCPSSGPCCKDGTPNAHCCSYACCDNKTCYHDVFQKCCDYGTGQICPKKKTCCGTTECCERTCNDNWECQKCDNGQCEQCLYKVGSYAELQSCDRVDDPDHEPTANGCGPAGGPQVPDNPAGCVGTSFLGPCNNHDICYGTCNSNKATCDHDFLNEMLDICSSGACSVYGCVPAAIAYYTAVSDHGQDAYESAQLYACACSRCN